MAKSTKGKQPQQNVKPAQAGQKSANVHTAHGQSTSAQQWNKTGTTGSTGSTGGSSHCGSC